LTLILFVVQIAASQEQILYSFYDRGGTVSPVSSLVSDASGNLYGTTAYSGANGAGTVFELSPTAGGWTETVLHNFNADGIDGFFATAGLVFDAAGNLYGTTQFGGTGSCTNGFGCGTVFELTPTASGTWTEKVLHNFTGPDGFQVHAGLTIDAAGNLYGTTVNGGSYGHGAVFEVSPTADGKWSGKVLHNFTGGSDGGVPYGGVVLDAAGNVYGMTSAGGGITSLCRFGCGTVFELSSNADGHWTGKALHSFSNKSGDGRYPSTALVFDAAGNLYGTAGAGGGDFNGGIVFELIPHSDGHWTEKVLHSFNQKRTDGLNPSADLILDAAGNLYGTTQGGGSSSQGTAFKLKPTASGVWSETILHSFSDQGGDGFHPNAALTFDAAGNLFGTTGDGGTNNEGTVFEITP
jgi:uncharacterized repeat protein (TIGR03803 family)